MRDRCPFCGNTQTLLHILSNCQVALDQGRFTALSPGMRLYSDMHGLLAPGGGSIPPDIIVTNLRPDIFIVNVSTNEVIIFELTCPGDGNIKRSHTFKEEKYSPLVADLSRRFRTYQYSVVRL